MIRDYKPEDLPGIKAIYDKQALNYPLPDLDTMIARRILLDDEHIVAAVACKPTADAYLLMDTSWQTPGLRLAALKTIHEDIRQILSQTNIVQVHGWIPPELPRSFGRRLMKDFGWWHTDWSCFVKEVK